jgi:deoxycytidylate deaminase
MKPEYPEIILSLVAPIGSDILSFTKLLKTAFLPFGFTLIDIDITDLLEPAAIIQTIQRHRQEHPALKKIYLLNQVKNLAIYEILNRIYDENYLQVSCFSSLEKQKESLSIETDAGKNMAKLFDKSHFFVNLDQSLFALNTHIQKLVEILFGIYKEYPSPEEYGMAVAYTVSKRSNFPGERHVGACITAASGEIIATGSIRAPTAAANPTRAQENAIQQGYAACKTQLTHFERLIENSNIPNPNKQALQQFVHNSMEFHPCTHAEMAAISDAAKLGISTRNATLYSTTFPCHMCTKDIISSGITKVVFLEAFPKSKNKELYSELIAIDPTEPVEGKVSFFTFCGVGPRKYNYFYSLENKQKEKIAFAEMIPPLLKFKLPYVYAESEVLITNECCSPR